MGGGIVQAVNTTFENCNYGANFENYFHYVNSSFFRGCTFNSNATGLGDVCFYTDATGGLLPATTYIAAWQWRGLNILSNSFNCDLSFRKEIRPTGAQLVRFGGIVGKYTFSGTGNTFSNLGTAVIASAAPAAYAVTIGHNVFDNNLYGVRVSGMNNCLVVKENTFQVPGAAGLYDKYPTGLTTAGCYGFDISQNTFDKCSGCTTSHSFDYNTGAVMNSGVTHTDVLNLNTFNQVYFASVPLGENGWDAWKSGLLFHCNNYNSSGFDILRASVFEHYPYVTNSLIHPNQGFCYDATSPAGNQFHTCFSGVPSRILANDAGVIQTVDYWGNAYHSDYDPGDPSTCIQTTNGSYTILTNNSCSRPGTDLATGTACPVPPDYPARVDESAIATKRADLVSLVAARAANTNPELDPEFETQEVLLLGYIGRNYAMNDSYDSAAALMEGYHMFRDAASYYLAAEDYTHAQAMVDSMPTPFPEDSLYKWEAQKEIDLYSTGHTWFDLDSTSKDSLQHIVQYNSAAGYMAGGIGSLLAYLPVTWPVPVIDTVLADSALALMGKPARVSGEAVTNVNKTATKDFSIFPNPTFGNFTVKATSAGTLTIYTLLGQQLANYNVNAGQTEMQLSDRLAAGMYMGVYRPADGGRTIEVRLVYEPK